MTRIGDTKHAAWCLISMAESLIALGELQEAEQCAMNAIAAAQAVESKFSLGWGYCTLGQVFLGRSHWEQAEEVLLKGISLGREIGYGDVVCLCRR